MYSNNTNETNKNTISMDWLDPNADPKDDCPYCGEENDIDFDRDDDGDEVIYRASCGRCGKSWGQAFKLVFDGNFEDN